MNVEQLDNFLFSQPVTGKYEWSEEANTVVFRKLAVFDRSIATKAKSNSSTEKRNKRKGHFIQSSKQDRRAVITIEDVKNVTFARIKNSGMHLHYSPRFMLLMRSSQMDRLLYEFAKYFQTYFEIIKFNEKFADQKLWPSNEQTKAQKERLELVKSLQHGLATAYADFLLFERQKYAEKQRIMYRPIDPAAEAIHDQKLFETIYWFLVFGVWIIFSRDNFKVICTEIGCFTRSDIFNSVGRMGAARFGKSPNVDQSINELYKTNLSRSVILNQRSPALRLLIPEPRDQVASLFHRLKTKTSDKLETENLPVVTEECQCYGILGDSRYLYDDQLIANSAEVGNEQVVNQADEQA